ncbi:MAG: SDR family NAD(P)-dependent oxidoreductase [Parvibaculales bacterium]
MKDFTDKVSVITGAAGGIGSALAFELAGKGSHLALCDVDETALSAVAESLKESGVKVTTHVLDVTKKSQFSRVYKDILKSHSKVNLVINNAGITLQKSFNNHSIKDLERMININLWGVVYGCHFFKDALADAAETDEAHVVNLSSMAAFAGFPNQSSYVFTKMAVQGLSDTLWAEWSTKGIGVTSVHPGAIRTNIMLATLNESDNLDAAKRNLKMAMKNATPPEDAARMIVDAISKNKKRLLIGKDAKILNFLAWIAPGLVNWLMKLIARKNQRDYEAYLAKNAQAGE